MPEKCAVCTKTVYEMEKQAYDTVAYHKWCFKCQMCACTLSLSNVAKIKGDIFCKPCFKKTFREAGNYASFGPKNLAANAPYKDLIAAGVVGSNSSDSIPSTPSTPSVNVPSEPVTPTAASPTFKTPKSTVATPTTSSVAEEEEKVVVAEVKKDEVKEEKNDAEMVVEEMDLDDIMQRMDINTAPAPITTTNLSSSKPGLSLNTNTNTPISSASTPTPTSTSSTPSYAKRGTVVITSAPKCPACTKSVYEMEKVSYNETAYHKWCLKCKKCTSNIGVGSVASDGNDIYCKPCFKKTFKEKGSYASFTPTAASPVDQ